jgi:hypothetical protein
MKLRGLLCFRCNMALGAIEKVGGLPCDWVPRAMEYLRVGGPAADITSNVPPEWLEATSLYDRR